MTLYFSHLDTPLGAMIATADEKALYHLEFLDCSPARPHVLKKRTKPIDQLEKELDQYFKGTLKTFQTPYVLVGTAFQKRVWEELEKIPYGETRSYSQIAEAIGRPTAYRAGAQANGANPITLLVPCHRVINSSGQLGGYAGKIERKKWMLEHESRH